MLRNQVLTMFKHAVDTGTFNQVLRNVQIGEVSKGRIIAELCVTKDCCNILDSLHGGMTATLFDHISTLALRSYFIADGNEAPKSVSVEISLSYMTGVKEGETIRIETDTVRVGQKMAFLTGTIYNKNKNDRLVATGKHTKFIL